jgi:hypothetical protein
VHVLVKLLQSYTKMHGMSHIKIKGDVHPSVFKLPSAIKILWLYFIK